MRGTFPRLAWFLLLGSVLWLGACGYRLGGVPCDEGLPVHSVAVPLFENRSFEPLAEDVFTRSFRERVRALPCVLLKPGGQAETTLRGTILRVEVFPVGVDARFLVLEYGMRAVVSLSLVNPQRGEILWQPEPLEEVIRFYAGRADSDPSDPVLLQANRREALVRLSGRMADRAMERLLLGF